MGNQHVPYPNPMAQAASSPNAGRAGTPDRRGRTPRAAGRSPVQRKRVAGGGTRCERLVLFEHRLVDPHVVPPGLREADRGIGLVDDRFLVQLGADLGIGIGPHLLLVRRQQDRMPGRQAAEHLAVLHREVLRHPVRAAHRVGADAERFAVSSTRAMCFFHSSGLRIVCDRLL